MWAESIYRCIGCTTVAVPKGWWIIVVNRQRKKAYIAISLVALRYHPIHWMELKTICTVYTVHTHTNPPTHPRSHSRRITNVHIYGAGTSERRQVAIHFVSDGCAVVARKRDMGRNKLKNALGLFVGAIVDCGLKCTSGSASKCKRNATVQARTKIPPWWMITSHSGQHKARCYFPIEQQ